MEASLFSELTWSAAPPRPELMLKLSLRCVKLKYFLFSIKANDQSWIPVAFWSPGVCRGSGNWNLNLVSLSSILFLTSFFKEKGRSCGLKGVPGEYTLELFWESSHHNSGSVWHVHSPKSTVTAFTPQGVWQEMAWCPLITEYTPIFCLTHCTRVCPKQTVRDPFVVLFLSSLLPFLGSRCGAESRPWVAEGSLSCSEVYLLDEGKAINSVQLNHMELPFCRLWLVGYWQFHEVQTNHFLP